LAKEVLNLISEKSFFIENMSGKIKLGPNQMPEIYNLLPPICEKLGIDEPELYLELNRNPNAYTFGDSMVAIVLTSGLLETFSSEEIQVIIAHECGHILCHHTLYKTIARMILLNGNYFLNGVIIL
jgi:Zn-dependent protease with chaperone function